jgi:hypothetical protein
MSISSNLQNYFHVSKGWRSYTNISEIKIMFLNIILSTLLLLKLLIDHEMYLETINSVVKLQSWIELFS